MPDPAIEAAIARGDATAKLLIGFRDALFEPCAGLLLIAGPAGLRACAAGVVEAVILANRPPCEPGEDRLLDHCTEDATVVPFGEAQG